MIIKKGAFRTVKSEKKRFETWYTWYNIALIAAFIGLVSAVLYLPLKRSLSLVPFVVVFMAIGSGILLYKKIQLDKLKDNRKD